MRHDSRRKKALYISSGCNVGNRASKVVAQCDENLENVKGGRDLVSYMH